MNATGISLTPNTQFDVSACENEDLSGKIEGIIYCVFDRNLPPDLLKELIIKTAETFKVATEWLTHHSHVFQAFESQKSRLQAKHDKEYARQARLTIPATTKFKNIIKKLETVEDDQEIFVKKLAIELMGKLTQPEDIQKAESLWQELAERVSTPSI